MATSHVEPTMTELIMPGNSHYQSARPLWSVASCEQDDAAPLVDAIFNDNANLEHMIYRPEWSKQMMEERFTIYDEDRPSKDDNDYRRVYIIAVYVLQRLITISAVNGQASALSTLLDYAVNHEIDISEVLDRKAVDASLRQGNHAVMEVICTKYPDIIKFNVHHGYTPLNIAAQRGNPWAVGALIGIGAKPGWYEINRAALSTSTSALEYFLANGATAEMINESVALHFAAADGKLEHIRVLAKHGADLNALHSERGFPHLNIPPEVEWTPMHSAAAKGQVEAMSLLESLGAATDALTGDGLSTAQILERHQQELLKKDDSINKAESK